MNRYLFVVVIGLTLIDPIAAADPSTLDGKVMCGYQGWFQVPADGGGWSHYGGKQGRFEPGNCHIELWPDMSEMDEDEKYPTEFKHADGSTAHVFSSQNPKTVMRHFKWLDDYGIDGVFLQRFAVAVQNDKQRQWRQNVMKNVRAGAEKHDRTWVMMYDLSGVGENKLVPLVTGDWKRLVDEDKIREDRMYQHHCGKPVVAVWGIGFNDHRKYTLAECLELITFLKDDPKYGGNTVMLGVPTFWRNLHRDAVNDPLLHEIIRKADIVSPWTVGRYDKIERFEDYLKKEVVADHEWCRKEGKDYLPVVFPGFSWYNLLLHRGQEAKFDQIPRLKGEFLKAQLEGHMKIGATMIYQAMFDELDEATAVFKCTNDPPAGASPFLTYEGLPSDFYLKMLGETAGKLKLGRSAIDR